MRDEAAQVDVDGGGAAALQHEVAEPQGARLAQRQRHAPRRRHPAPAPGDDAAAREGLGARRARGREEGGAGCAEGSAVAGEAQAPGGTYPRCPRPQVPSSRDMVPSPER